MDSEPLFAGLDEPAVDVPVVCDGCGTPAVFRDGVGWCHEWGFHARGGCTRVEVDRHAR